MKRISPGLSALIFAIAVYCPLSAEQTKSAGAKTKTTKSATSDSPVLARVNGHAITEADLDFFAKMLKLTTEEVPQQREQMIERLIDQQLLRAFLAQKKIAADPKVIDEHLTRIKTRLKARGEDFDKLLAKSGFREESLRRELTLPLGWEAYIRQTVTDQKLREVWKERKQEFDGTEVNAAQVVLKSDDSNADVKRLAALREQIVSGKLSFADAAKKHSQGTTANKGGDLGRFGFRGLQPPPFPQIAFRLKVGEVSQPFRSASAVHLLTVTERVEGQLSLEDARPEILQQLSIELQKEILQQEREKAKIERAK